MSGGDWAAGRPRIEKVIRGALNLTLELMKTVITATIYLSYLTVTDYFTEIMCPGLQMESTWDHPLSCRQIKFQTLLL